MSRVRSHEEITLLKFSLRANDLRLVDNRVDANRLEAKHFYFSCIVQLLLRRSKVCLRFPVFNWMTEKYYLLFEHRVNG